MRALRLIYSAPNLLLVRHWKNFLESHGIDCIIKNESLSGAAGELPPTECWPELWLIDDKYYNEARRLLDADGENKQPWTCPNCDEFLEGQFDRCWNCGEYRID
ncbi:MAG: putative signal transducing protein [Candidatus Nitrosoglobus sp.]